MAELSERAGLLEPEFEERAGELVVRFFPSSYVPPRKIEHPLTELQQRILEALGRDGAASLGEVLATLGDGAPRRAVQKDLIILRELGLVGSSGWARGAKWRLLGRK